MGYLFALITTLCWSLGIFPFTEAARRFGTEALNQFRLFLAWIFLSIICFVALAINPINLFTQPTSHQYFYLGISGVIGFTLGDYFSFNSFRLLGPKLSSIYTTLAPCSALLFGLLFLNEKINLIGLIGMLITIAGVLWLSFAKSEKDKESKEGFTRNTSGILFGIGGAVCQGLGLVLSKLGLQATENSEELHTLHAVWIRLLFGFGIAFIISLFRNKFRHNASIILRNEQNGLKYMLAGTILGPVIGVSCSLIAIHHLKVAEAQTIFALLPVIVMPMSFFIYKEKITLTSVMACLVSIAGVMILIWRDQIL